MVAIENAVPRFKKHKVGWVLTVPVAVILLWLWTSVAQAGRSMRNINSDQIVLSFHALNARLFLSLSDTNRFMLALWNVMNPC
jgi:hypothetical protein